jgi:hypothetical protein
VVQIRHFRAIPGEVFERAAREAKLSGFVARPVQRLVAARPAQTSSRETANMTRRKQMVVN